MLKLFYKELLVMQSDNVVDFLDLMHQLEGNPLMKTNDKKNYFLILND